MALATLPLNSPAANGSSAFGNSVGVNGRTSSSPQAGTQIIVQPETMLEFSTAGPLLVAIQIQNGLPVPQNAASGDAVLAADGSASASQPH